MYVVLSRMMYTATAGGTNSTTGLYDGTVLFVYYILFVYHTEKLCTVAACRRDFTIFHFS